MSFYELNVQHVLMLFGCVAIYICIRSQCQSHVTVHDKYRYNCSWHLTSSNNGERVGILQFHSLNLEGRILFYESSSLLTLSTGQDLLPILALDQAFCGSCQGLIGPFHLELLEWLEWFWDVVWRFARH